MNMIKKSILPFIFIHLLPQQSINQSINPLKDNLDDSKIKLKWGGIIEKKPIKAYEWTSGLTSFGPVFAYSETTNKMGPMSQSELKVEFQMTESFFFYFKRIYLPSSLLCWTSMSVFLIDPREIMARTLISYSSLIGLIFCMQVWKDGFYFSSTLTVIDAWFGSCLILIIANMIISTWTIQVVKNGQFRWQIIQIIDKLNIFIFPIFFLSMYFIYFYIGISQFAKLFVYWWPKINQSVHISLPNATLSHFLTLFPTKNCNLSFTCTTITM